MSGAVQPLLQFYVNSSVALQVIFLFGAFSYLLHSLYVFVTPLVPTLCVPWSVYLNIDASVHSWLYKLLLNRNYVLKMTPEHRTDGSIFLSFSESKKKKERLWECLKRHCWLQWHVGGWLFIRSVYGRDSTAWNIQYNRLKALSTMQYWTCITFC